MQKFQTPIANVTFSEEEIVYVDFTGSDFPLFKLIDHYQILRDELGKERYHFIYTFPPVHTIRIPRDARKYNNEQLAKHTSSLAMPSKNGMIRTFVNMYIRLGKLPFPTLIAKSMKEAEEWTLNVKEKINQTEPELEMAAH